MRSKIAWKIGFIQFVAAFLGSLLAIGFYFYFRPPKPSISKRTIIVDPGSKYRLQKKMIRRENGPIKVKG